MDKMLHKISILALIIFGIILIFGCSPASPSTPSTPAAPTATSLSPTPTTVSPTSPAGQPVTINLTAQNLSFDTDTITVPAGASVTVVFENRDRQSHNLAVYNEALSPGQAGAADQIIFRGEIVNGPGTATYQFTAPQVPGTYFFRCDPHPNIMTGDFVVSG